MDELLIAERIRTARKTAGLSQEALAESLGVTKFTVCRWEKGSVTGVSLRKLHDIARAVGVSGQFLLYGTTDPDERVVMQVLDTIRKGAA